MTIIKNGCICGGDYYTTTEQCDNIDCKSQRKDANCETDETKLTKIEILEKLSKSFNEADKEEPFINREYVEETQRIYDNLINGGIDEYQERAINDIVSDIFRHFKTEGHTEI